jgi:hypothetical protein
MNHQLKFTNNPKRIVKENKIVEIVDRCYVGTNIELLMKQIVSKCMIHDIDSKLLPRDLGRFGCDGKYRH